MKQSTIERWLLLWLCLGSVVALVWPRLLPNAIDPFVIGKHTLAYSIAGIMFTIGCVLPRDELKQLARWWPTVLLGTTIQYITLPVRRNCLPTCAATKIQNNSQFVKRQCNVSAENRSGEADAGATNYVPENTAHHLG